MRHNIKHLFSELGWHSVVEHQKKALRQEIENLSPKAFEECSIDELKTKMLKKFSLNTPEINSDDLDVSQCEVDIERGSAYGSRYGSRYVKGTEVTVRVPYTGDKEMFRVQPSTYDLSPPRGRVTADYIVFSIIGSQLTPEYVKTEIESQIASIKEYLGFMEQSVADYPKQLETLSKQLLERKAAKLSSDKQLIAGLGYKVKENA